MSRTTGLFGLATAMLILMAGTAKAGPNLVLNGDFQTGSLTDWSLTGNTDFSSVVSGGPDGHFAQLGPMNTDGHLTQQIATTAGDSYAVSFVLGTLQGATPDNDFSATFGGQTVFSQVNVPNQDFTLYSFTVSATGPSSDLSFAYHDNPSYFDLTGISVVDLGPSIAPAPEPSTLVSAGIAGLLGFGYAWRRRRAKRTA
jgi:hypothetical protein